MSDISRNTDHSLIEANIELKIKHYEIQLNEQENQVKNLAVSLDKLKSVEIKRYELAIDVAKKQIEQTKCDLKQLKLQANAVDVTNK